MPNAPWQQKIFILKLIKQMFKTGDKVRILDVGCGIGSTGCILKTGLANLKLTLIGLEVFDLYRQYMHENNIDDIYDAVLPYNIKGYLDYLPSDFFSAILFIDVLEHMTTIDAVESYNKAQCTSSHIIATIPLTASKRGSDGINPYMAHLEAYPTIESVTSTFPGLKHIKTVQQNGVFRWSR